MALNKSAAKAANQLLDTVASDITKNAEMYGIKPEIAQKFAFQCDLMADHIAKRAGVDVAKLAEQVKQGLSGEALFHEGSFDPEEVGSETSGPEEKDSDESFMDAQFTQQWNRELREKQQSGELSNGSGSPEVQAPTPGVQASIDHGAKLAKLCLGLQAASGRCASSTDAGVQLLGQHLASAGSRVLEFQARALSAGEKPERVASVVSAADLILPHVASDVSPEDAAKVAQMVSTLAGLTQAPKAD